MKNRMIRLFLLVSVLGLMVESADAQQKKTSRPKSKKTVVKKDLLIDNIQNYMPCDFITFNYLLF